MYRPHHNGQPFGPHPRRGFETVPFILEGDILHKDNSEAETQQAYADYRRGAFGTWKGQY
ncbi:hypothetical protein BEN47_03490 [Hymenobacter lapidarius]|uniref:Pirin N-terminal domain-containing protein n=1 Tax=Hymenobacter lapidarius TaxID=1908237 RepID=A0A1G1SXL0_9BACT|nr:hypothetical protein BEN47_03490 [Hymenobacter lapidarius]